MKRLLAILVLAASVFSASATTLFGTRVPSILRDNGVFCQSLVHDTRYWVPSEKWLTDTLRPAWRKESRFLRYTPESFDCDDFARDCAAFSASRFQRHLFGLPVAEFYYFQDTGTPHVINLFLIDGSGIEVVFFEPQGGHILSLSKREVASAFLVKF